MSQFDRALDFVLRWEGGYSNDPDDPGGETKFGISRRAYPDVNIKDLTREGAAAIYKRDYWDVFACDSRQADCALAIFDTCVNCGIARTALWLEDSKDTDDLLNHRKVHYETLAKKKPLMGKFLKGWMNRLAALGKEIEDHKEQKS